LGGFRNLKHLYLYYVQNHLKGEFPKTVSYNRFVGLQQKAMLPMLAFLKMMRSGTCTGISFVDSASVRVCNNKRIFNHKVFREIAERGKTTVGYFYGFKLHCQGLQSTERFAAIDQTLFPFPFLLTPLKVCSMSESSLFQ
jgi:hypothetical protein